MLFHSVRSSSSGGHPDHGKQKKKQQLVLFRTGVLKTLCQPIGHNYFLKIIVQIKTFKITSAIQIKVLADFPGNLFDEFVN